MAIDFMTMPLSRYLSGDFLTPAMAFAWQQGSAYSILGPDGRRDIPKGTPLGGANAAATRARFVPMILDDLRRLPDALSANLWDEASSAAPTFHRVDPSSYGRLLEEARSRLSPSSDLGASERTAARPAHLAASVFFPMTFDAPFDMPVVFERVAGSAPMAVRELETGHWSDAASSARDTLLDALRDAMRLRLPMIVDM